MRRMHGCAICCCVLCSLYCRIWPIDRDAIVSLDWLPLIQLFGCACVPALLASVSYIKLHTASLKLICHITWSMRLLLKPDWASPNVCCAALFCRSMYWANLAINFMVAMFVAQPWPLRTLLQVKQINWPGGFDWLLVTSATRYKYNLIVSHTVRLSSNYRVHVH